METPDIVIDEMHPEDIPGGMRLSKSENWNQTEQDWELLLQEEGNVCLCARHGDRLAGTTTAAVYGGKMAWIGMVIVDREYRGFGLSRKLLQETFTRLKGIGSIKLDATPAGYPVYKKSGFVDEYSVYRMTRVSVPYRPDELRGGDDAQIMTGEHLTEVISMDAEVFGAERGYLIRSLFRRSPGKSRVVVKNNRVAGFILGRMGSRYMQWGPLGARNEKIAGELMSSVLKEGEEESLVVDVPGARATLIARLEETGFAMQRSFTRMYLQKNPFPGLKDHQYLISGPEFG